MTVAQFWNEFMADNAKFPVMKHCENMKYTKMEKVPEEGLNWKLNMTVPVQGVPFMNETRAVRKSEVRKEDKKIVMEVDTKTIDAPYSETFSSKECWIIISSSKN